MVAVVLYIMIYGVMIRDRENVVGVSYIQFKLRRSYR